VDEETESIRRKLAARRTGDETEHPLVRTLLVSEHGPTHVDAFSHLDPTSDGSVDRIPLERFYGDAVGLDVSSVSEEAFVTESVLRSALDAADLELRPGDAVTLHTGHRAATYAVDDPAGRRAYLTEYVGLSRDGATWLAEQGVGSIGVDAPSIDHGSAMETKDYPAHDVCASHGLLNYENMANLDAVAGRRYTLCAFPLKVRGGTGSPVRAVGIVD